MAKSLYYPHEVIELLDEKLNEMAIGVVNDETLSLEDLDEKVHEIRTFRKFRRIIVDALKENGEG